VKTEQGGLEVERNGNSSEDDITRLTREVESLKMSVQTLRKDREEHVSIMRHLVHDIFQNHIGLSDIVRERLDRHAPSVLHKHPSAHHVASYPYTPSQSSATPTIVKRERDGSLNIHWTRSSSTAAAQDVPPGDYDSSFFSAKRQRTDLVALDNALLSLAADSSQSAASRFGSMSFPTPILQLDQPIRKQATPGPNHDQNLPGPKGNRQRPPSDIVRPGEIIPPPPIGFTSEYHPLYPYNDDLSDLLPPLATHQAVDEVLGIDPELRWQQSTEYDTGFADNPFDTSFCDSWTSFENNFAP
jgi:hypothetical protein